MKRVFLFIVLFASSILHAEPMKSCSVDVVKVVRSNNVDIPDDVTIMSVEQVVESLADYCQVKRTLSEALKDKRDAENRFNIAQSKIDQIMKRLKEKRSI